MSRLPFAAVLALGLVTQPAFAQDSTQGSTLGDAQREAAEGLGKLLQALQMFVKSVPQFSAPEVLPNGDIIIRRIHPDKDPAPAPSPDNEHDSTST